MIDLMIAQANDRLKSQGIRFRIHQRGMKLTIIGKLPPMNTRKEIYTGTDATIPGVMLTEAKCLELAAKLALGLPIEAESSATVKTIGQWVAEFEDDYFSKRKRTDASQLTWNKDYLSTFRKLDSNVRLTATVIENLVKSTPPDTRLRKRCCYVLGALAKFAGIEVNLSPYSGSYNHNKVKRRNLPGDDLIINCHNQITDHAWKWVYGMLATYGLRNHEVFRLDYQEITKSEVLRVLDGKTGSRIVYPIYPEWYGKFSLNEVVLPSVDTNNSNSSLGHTVAQWFRRHEIPFHAYDLRHAWAVRSLLFGLDVSLAAKMMGHSLKVHSETYHQWISEQQYKQAFKLLSDRK
jgi:integrase